MIAWNPRAPSNWANLFGFVAVPLFGKQRQPSGPDEHFVLLDGKRSSLTFSRGDSQSLLKSRKPMQWAWSSNVPRSIVVDEETTKIYAVRWDDPDNVRELNASSPETAQTFLFELEAPAKAAADSSIDKALAVFRSVRLEVREHGGDDYDSVRAFETLLLLADSMRSQKISSPASRALGDVAVEMANSTRGISETTFPPSVSQLPIGDMAVQLLKENEGYSLDPYLLIRHASGTLFQEAHIELNNPPKPDPKLFVSLRDNLPKPSGTARRDVHYTPTPLARFLSEEVLKEFRRLNPNSRSVSIVDPACGSGVFLVEALRDLEGTGISANITGIDTSKISTIMTEFTLKSAKDDFVASGGTVTASIEEADSLKKSWNNPDVVLMNPPFLPWTRLDSRTRKKIKDDLGNLYHGRADTAIAFVAKATKELKPGAVLGTVIPAAFLQSKAASKLRKELTGQNWHTVLVGRVRDYGYFPEATVEPAFIIVSRAPRGTEPTRTFLAESDAADRAIRKARITPPASQAKGEGWELSFSNLDKDDWTPRPQESAQILKKIRSLPSSRSVTELYDVRLGIRTGENNVFTISEQSFKDLGEDEQAWFKPIANEIRRGRIQRSQFVFYPYKDGKLVLKTEAELTAAVPNFYRLNLKPNADDLKTRSSVRDRKWWELSEPRTMWLRFGRPRIVSMTYARRGAFALDTRGEYAVVQGYGWIWKGQSALSDEQLLAYFAVFNSPMFEALLDYSCRRTQGGQYELSPLFLSNVPLPDLTRTPQRQSGKLTDLGRMIRQGAYVSLHSLNQAIAMLYGTTVEEFISNLPLTLPSRLELEFEELASKWKRETAMYSSPAQAMRHPSIRRIREMGPSAISLIIRDLEHRPSRWFGLLQELTGENPVPANKRGFLDESASAWITWARNNGYDL